MLEPIKKLKLNHTPKNSVLYYWDNRKKIQYHIQIAYISEGYLKPDFYVEAFGGLLSYK
jgi:hypothetical protein